MTPRLSAYVPSFNAERTLSDCLDSIYSQTIPFSQVIVVDDGSTDRTSDIAAGFDVELVRNPVNRGIAASRNIGLSRAHSPVVAGVDADCVLPEDWTEILLAHLKRSDVAMAGGALHERILDTLPDAWRDRHMPQNWGTEPQVNPPFLFGCNILCKRAAILSVGGYDEKFTTNGEDVDISRRLKGVGWTLIYDPQARVSHLQKDTLRSVMARWWRWHNSGRDSRALRDSVRNIPRYLSHSLRFMRRDIVGNPRLLSLDLVFPIAQLYFETRAAIQGRV